VGSVLPSLEAMQAKLDQWATRYHVAGAVFAVSEGDEIRTAAVGVVNQRTGVATTTDTLFQIGSISKVYTTTLVMQLVDEGVVRLDDPVTTYLPDLAFMDAAVTGHITVRHLLTHTSGIDGDFFDDFGRGDDCVEKYVTACRSLPSVFPPAAMWSYCNAGFVVLGRLIEVVTGLSWDRVLRERLLKPLSLEQTLTLPEEAILHRTSVGHVVNPALEVTVSPRWSLPRALGPAGATICASASDVLAFAAFHLRGGLSTDATKLLSASSLAAMQESQVECIPLPGRGPGHWGLGWMLFNWSGRRVLGHDGGTIGQEACLRIDPESGFAMVLLMNTTPTAALLKRRAIEWLFGDVLGVELPPRPVPPATIPQFDLAPYVGIYERLGLRFDVTLRDGGLITTATATAVPADDPAEAFQPQSLTPVDDTAFLEYEPRLNTYTPIAFSGFEGGRPRYLLSGAGRVARRV
jgi:CubicO group peptidase (beta-lactamase class C family)